MGSLWPCIEQPPTADFRNNPGTLGAQTAEEFEACGLQTATYQALSPFSYSPNFSLIFSSKSSARLFTSSRAASAWARMRSFSARARSSSMGGW